MAADWFCKIDGNKVGPFTPQQLKTIVAKGQLRPEHLIRRGNEGAWVPAGRVKGLFPEQSATAKPASKSPAAKSPPAPQRPAADVPEGLTLGGHKKHHVSMNVDKLDIDAEPVMVSHRKTKGMQGLNKSEQKKLNLILLCVIGGGMTVGILIFIIAYATGMLSAPPPPQQAKKDEVKTEPSTVEKKPPETAAKKETDSERDWAKTDSWIPSGNAELKIYKLTRGLPPEGAKLDKADDEVLAVPLQLKVKSGGKQALDYSGWDADSVKKNISLHDDSNRKYELLGIVDAKEAGKKLEKPIVVQFLFQLPPKDVKFVRLELPAEPYGGQGMVKFQIAAKDIEVGKQKPEKPAPPPEEKSAPEKKQTKKVTAGSKKAARSKPATPKPAASKPDEEEEAAIVVPHSKAAKEPAKKEFLPEVGPLPEEQ
jgi:hypothetical protein